ncbi:alpha/beta hydrolase [Mycobacteriaceae bacterium NPDC060252]
MSELTRRPDLRTRLVAWVLYLLLRPISGLIPANRLVIHAGRAAIHLACLASFPLRGTAVRRIDGKVRGEWVSAPAAEDGAGVILLLHGSGYAICSPRTHRGFASYLSQYSGLPVFTAQYRRAPESVFPAAEDDVFAAYQWLLANGYRPEQITVAGDSAGGHLAITLTSRAVAEGVPPPAALALFGPLIDPSFTASFTDKRIMGNPFSPRGARRILALYVADHDIADPRLSVLNGDLGRLPPVQLHYGSLEVMRADNERFAAQVRSSGGTCVSYEWPGFVHGYWILPRLLPEARRSIEIAARFLTSSVLR